MDGFPSAPETFLKTNISRENWTLFRSREKIRQHQHQLGQPLNEHAWNRVKNTVKRREKIPKTRWKSAASSKSLVPFVFLTFLSRKPGGKRNKKPTLHARTNPPPPRKKKTKKKKKTRTEKGCGLAGGGWPVGLEIRGSAIRGSANRAAAGASCLLLLAAGTTSGPKGRPETEPAAGRVPPRLGRPNADSIDTWLRLGNR